MPCARRDSRFPPFRTERGKMGHPSFLGEGEIEWAGVLGDARSIGCARDDRLSRGLARGRGRPRHTGDLVSCDIIRFRINNFATTLGAASAGPFFVARGMG